MRESAESCTWRELAAPYRLTLWARNMQPRYNIAPTTAIECCEMVVSLFEI
jgi:hypothetical protein